MTAEQFRRRMVEIRCVDRDVIERAGICPDTAARMVRDPFHAFLTMSVGERARFWPLVETAIENEKRAP